METIILGGLIGLGVAVIIVNLWKMITKIGNFEQDLYNLKHQHDHHLEQLTARHIKRMEDAIELALGTKNYEYKKLQEEREIKPTKKRRIRKKEK